jgi:RHS repeat-associated protein
MAINKISTQTLPVSCTQLTVNDIQPKWGPIGTVVTITGTCFGNSQIGSTVSFNGTLATPTSWNETQIVVPVPVGTTLGRDDESVTVNGVTVDGVSFLVTSPASISGVSPTSGPAGTTVTITGAGFGRKQRSSTVSFNGTLATPLSWSDTQIVVSVPNGASSGNVSVTVAGIVSNGVAFTVTSSIFVSTNGMMGNARYDQTSTLLTNGKVLVTGGVNATGVLNSAELFDPTTQLFSPSGTMYRPRWLHTSTLLNNGQVLVIGGSNATPPASSAQVVNSVTPSQSAATANPDLGIIVMTGPLSVAEFYDPVAGGFITLPSSLHTARMGHTATLLPNGQVLVVGGYNPSTGIIPSAELYDPATQTFIALGNTAIPRSGHTATLLSNGQVLITGGQTDLIPSGAYNSAEIYDPAAMTFTALSSSMITAREGHRSTLLPSGQVLITGGDLPGTGSLGTAEIYNPLTNSFTAIPGSMAVARINHQANLLNTGQVLITGGATDTNSSSVALSSAELLDPTTQVFTLLNSMTSVRNHHTATLLNDGSVLVDGGTDGTNFFTTAELYLPSLLSGLASITVAPTNPTISIGTQQRLTASGIFGNGNTQTLSSAIWTSSNNTIATVSSDSSDFGVTFGMADGTATISACAGGVCGSTTISVGPSTSPAPIIMSVSPSSGSPGSSVVIAGNNFQALPIGGTVTFNGIAAVPASWNNTTIVVPVPNGSTSGQIVVQVYGQTAQIAFIVISAPAITSALPITAATGTTLSIQGTSFGISPGTVSINSTAVTPSEWTDTEILAPIPVGVTSGNVSVNANGMSSNVVGFTVATPIFYAPVDTVVTLTDSLGNQSTYPSNLFGEKMYVTDSLGSGCVTCGTRGVTHNTYDLLGNITSVTDALGNTTYYSYDQFNNVTSLVSPVSARNYASSQYTYNNFGEVLTSIDPVGNVTANTYDAKGNLVMVTSPTQSVTRFAYDGKGELIQITNPLGNVTTLAYYPTGLVQSITDAQNSTTSYSYDARGNRISVIDPINGSAHPTTYSYDSMSRLTGTVYPDGSSVSYGYDYRGRQTSVTDQNGKTTNYVYDDADRLVSVTDAAGSLTQYSYDTENNLLSITDANGNTTSFNYDAYGRVVQTAFPSSLTEGYTYDAVGNLVSKTDRKGQMIAYVYDALSRLTQKSYPDSTSVAYVYDLAGRLLNITDPTGSYGAAYDNMGRRVGTTTSYAFMPGQTYTDSYTYDAASRRTAYTSPDGSTSTYAYDSLNRLTGLTNSWAGAFSYGYDAMSRRTSLGRPNGVNTSYQYDSISRLLSVLHGGTGDGASYSYDPAGNRLSKHNLLEGFTENYSYDALYQLTQVLKGTAATERYTYDAVGNRLASLSVSPLAYNNSNELTSSPANSFTYDPNGNLTSKTSSSGTTSYAWDFENRLTSVTLPVTGGGTNTVTFAYDPLGRRIRKSSASGTTIYLYDGANIVAEISPAGSLAASYVQGSGIDQPLAMRRNGTIAYYQADGLGSITSLTNAAGNTVSSYVYKAFGATTATEGIFNPFRFTGREQDPETGLYYYRARYYDPTIGRFISEDPIGFKGGVNKYSYAGANPILHVDPMGLLYGCPTGIFETACESQVTMDRMIFDQNLFIFLTSQSQGSGNSPGEWDMLMATADTQILFQLDQAAHLGNVTGLIADLGSLQIQDPDLKNIIGQLADDLKSYTNGAADDAFENERNQVYQMLYRHLKSACEQRRKQ